MARKVPQANIDRLKYEIGVVKTMGYTNYYLIVGLYQLRQKSGYPGGAGTRLRCGQYCCLLRGHHGYRPHPL